MCMGLTFIGYAHSIAARTRWEAEMRRAERDKDREARWSLGLRNPLSEEEREILRSIRRQLSGPPLPESRKKCPECGRRFRIVVVKHLELDYCPPCRSCWFDPGELTIFSGMDRDIPAEELKHRRSKLPCAVCRKVMEEYVYLAPYNLLVDRCRYGHGVYLQDREIERVFEIT